jgi:F-type H+-transporting ATPase subunit epsilon
MTMVDQQEGSPFTVKVLTPTGKVAEGRASLVLVPGHDGEMGMKGHHREYVGNLGGGILKFHCLDTGKDIRIAILGGFCRFKENELVILADVADVPESVDRANYDVKRDELHSFIQGGYALEPARISAAKELKRIKLIDKLIAN